MQYNLWLENRVKEDALEALQQAKERIGKYGYLDYRAASEADTILRGVRGMLKMSGMADQDFNLTRLANLCNGLSHLDPKKREKIQQIQTDIDKIIASLS